MPGKDKKLVYKVNEYTVPGSNKTVMFFCPFAIPGWLLALPMFPIWHLRRHGYNVVVYSYHVDIAIRSVQLTVTNLQAIIDDAGQKIARIDPSVEISCFGTSMGTVLAANVAARHQRIQKVILNLSYADISDHIVALPSIRTISTKRLKAYLATVDDERHLRQSFDPYSPLTLVQEFRGKRLLVYSSRDDHILQQIHTTKFHVALQKAAINLEYHQNRGGRHFFAALVNYLRYRKWLRFLE